MPTSSPSSENALELSLTNDLRELAPAAAAIDEFCTGRELGTQLSYAVDLSVNEILSYCIANAYDDEDVHPIEVAVYLDAQEVMLLIVNDGIELSVRPPSSGGQHPTLDEGRLDELGLFLVYQVMDTVRYERQQGCNVVVMTKRLPSEVVSSQ